MSLAVVDPVDLPKVHAQMCSSYRMRSRVHITDYDHNFVADISSTRTSGAVTVDTSQPVTRSLRLETFDPDDVFGLEANEWTSPKYMIRAWRDIYVDALNRWVEIPVFWGPMNKPSRAGGVLSIEAQDKAALASFETSVLTLPKGSNAATAIQRCLIHAGETRFKFLTTTKTIKREYVIGVDATPWTIAQQIAESMGWVLFYDADGYAVLKVAPSGSSFTFRTGNGGSIISPVNAGFWDTDVVNRVIVEGATINGKKIIAVATLNPNHPLSPENLARNDRFNSGLRIYRAPQMDSLDTPTEAGKWAEAELHRLSIQQRTVAVDVRPIWDLQEYDMYDVADDLAGIYATARLNQSTIPLEPDGVQSIGYLRRPGKQTKARVSTRVYKIGG